MIQISQKVSDTCLQAVFLDLIFLQMFTNRTIFLKSTYIQLRFTMSAIIAADYLWLHTHRGIKWTFEVSFKVFNRQTLCATRSKYWNPTDYLWQWGYIFFLFNCLLDGLLVGLHKKILLDKFWRTLVGQWQTLVEGWRMSKRKNPLNLWWTQVKWQIQVLLLLFWSTLKDRALFHICITFSVNYTSFFLYTYILDVCSAYGYLHVWND